MSKTQWYLGAPNAVVLCINRNAEGELGGQFYHSYSKSPVPFEGIGQMTLRMEKLYDWLRFPYPGNSSRSFTDVTEKTDGRVRERKKIMSDEALLARHGDIGTFIVRVQHRQNSSWQGRITWMEEDRTIQFRSVWEMIKLIESAVDSVCSEEDGEENTWFPEEEPEPAAGAAPDRE